MLEITSTSPRALIILKRNTYAFTSHNVVILLIDIFPPLKECLSYSGLFILTRFRSLIITSCLPRLLSLPVRALEVLSL